MLLLYKKYKSMKIQIYCWLFAFIVSNIKYVHNYEMNMTEYFKMPHLYDFDDYDRCLQEFTNISVYCFVRVEVTAQPDSRAWQAIDHFSQFKRHHFDHRHLYYGLCVNWCANALSELGSNQTVSLYTDLLVNNSKVNTYVNLFATEKVNRQLYNRMLNQCINLRLQRQHGLSATTMIEYCDNNQGGSIEQDEWNSIFYTVLSVLFFFIMACTLFDFCMKHKRDKVLTARDHYKSSPTRSLSKICVSFSLPRNWYRLNQESNDKIGRDLRFLDCFKFLAMFLVIFAHTTWIIYESAVINPQDPERLLHTVAGTYLVAGSLIVVTFFVISGLLLTLNWLAATRNQSDLSFMAYIWLFIQFNIFRYIRLTVPYAFVLLISGVYFDNPGGPLWRHIFEREQLSCRKNWWTNLLYINNYVNNNERCMLQSWYLAADTQCFIVSLILLIISHKWPRMRVLVLGSAAVLAFIIPGIVTYASNFDAIFLPTPQTQRDSFIDNAQFTHFYAPFYMNFGSYLAGILAAIAYDYIAANQLKIKKYVFLQCIWFALIPIAIIWMLAHHPFLQNDYADLPRILEVIFAALQRNVWGFGLGAFIVGMAAKFGWILRKFACLPMFRMLGRLTYGAFMTHLFMARLVISHIRQPIFFAPTSLFTFVFFNVVASYLSSFVLAMLVELPVSSLLRLLR